jgi:hypothetical protein
MRRFSANHDPSRRSTIFPVIIGLLLGGAAIWGANKQALGLFHDDAIYAVVAKSVYQGDGYRIISLPTAPLQTKYPFLYSYLLSWFWALSPSFPDNIIVLKTFNAVVLMAIFFTSLVVYRRCFSGAKLAGLVFAVVVCTNPLVFTFTDYVISDLLFVLLALGALTICSASPNASVSMARLSLLAALTGLACLTRLAAVPLVLAGGLYSFMSRGWRGVALFSGIVLISITPWLLWTAHGPHAAADSLFGYYAAYNFSGARAGESGAWLHHYWTIASSNAVYLVGSFEMLYLLPLLPGLGFFVVGLTLIGALLSLRRDDLAAWCFFLSSLALLLLWPFHPGRYVLPLVPVLVLFLFRGMKGVEHWFEGRLKESPSLRWVGKVVWCPVMLILILNSVWLSSYLLVNDDQTTRGLFGSHVPYGWRGFEESFAWIRQHAPADALLATAYDPMYYLYTGRQAIRPALHRPATYFYPYGQPHPDVGLVNEVKPQLQNLKVNYLIIDPLDGYAEGQATLRLFNDLVQAYGDKAKNVFTSADGKHKIYALAQGR